MNKTLSERIQLKMEKRQLSSLNKVSFLAIRDEIADALSKGFSIISVWETLQAEGKVTSTYNTFRLNVKKHIGNYSSSHKFKA
jgi:hypothetical protein